MVISKMQMKQELLLITIIILIILAAISISLITKVVLTDKAEDEWTTVVYEKDLHAKKLPKTGK